MRIAIILVLAFLLDCLLGDPHNPWHPICLIGNLIAFVEKILRKILPKTNRGELFGGILLVALVVTISTSIPLIIVLAAWKIHIAAAMVVEIIMCYQLLAAKSLKDESMKVYEALHRDDVEGARYAVSMIVGRDTSVLDRAGITRAAVETVAENASDGVIAPMIWMAIGGVGAGFFYKAVNTMDSMVGYKNEKYMYFGRAAAKLDDVLNFVPSRVAGILFVAAAKLIGLDAKGAMRIFLRDRKKHASPNSAQTEAACAGALGVRLAGDAWYFGKLHKKPYIGEALRPIEDEDIVRANRLMYAASTICLILCVIIRVGVIYLICR